MKLLTLSLIIIAIWIILLVLLICRFLYKKIKNLKTENEKLIKENKLLMENKKQNKGV